MTPNRWIAIGALWAALGVALGAFGAHGLEERLAEREMTETWSTAVDYHVWHGMALVLVGLFLRGGHVKSAGAALLAVGSLLFSGSLYGLSLGAPGAVLGPITPLGGVLLLAGWIAFSRSALRAERGSRNA